MVSIEGHFGTRPGPKPRFAGKGGLRWAMALGTMASALAITPVLSQKKTEAPAPVKTQAMVQSSAKPVLPSTPEMRLYFEELRTTRPFLITPAWVDLIEELQNRPLNPNTPGVQQAVAKLKAAMPKPGTPEMTQYKDQLQRDLKQLETLARQMDQAMGKGEEFNNRLKAYTELYNKMPKYTPDVNFEKKEVMYARVVDQQTINKLLELYRADADGKADVYIAGFTGPGERVPDLGYAPVLRVVKRYKDIYVNEHWHVNDAAAYLSGDPGLARLPDVIRIHYRHFPGEAKVPGSEGTHLYDELRIVWDAEGKPIFYRQKQYSFDEEKKSNVRNPLPSPVSTPLSCLGCHSSESALRDRFRLPSESKAEFQAQINYESLVQHFEQPAEKQRGYQEYLNGLKKLKDVKKDLIPQAEMAMKQGKTTLQLPYMVEVLEGLQKDLQHRSPENWDQVIPQMGGDYEVINAYSQPKNTGIYTGADGKLYEDSYIATERMSRLLGLDLWWSPPAVFPPAKSK